MTHYILQEINSNNGLVKSFVGIVGEGLKKRIGSGIYDAPSHTFSLFEENASWEVRYLDGRVSKYRSSACFQKAFPIHQLNFVLD